MERLDRGQRGLGYWWRGAGLERTGQNGQMEEGIILLWKRFLQVAFNRSYCGGIPTKCPALRRVNSRFLRGRILQPSGTPVQPVQTENSGAEAQGSCCILCELSLSFIVAQVPIEPASVRRSYYHGSMSQDSYSSHTQNSSRSDTGGTFSLFLGSSSLPHMSLSHMPG